MYIAVLFFIQVVNSDKYGGGCIVVAARDFQAGNFVGEYISQMPTVVTEAEYVTIAKQEADNELDEDCVNLLKLNVLLVSRTAV